MVELCHVQGTIIAPDNLPVANTPVSFTVMPTVVTPSRNGETTTAPKVVTTTTDSTGHLSVNLEPGVYQVTITPQQRKAYQPYRIYVPDVADANLAHIQFTTTHLPGYVKDILSLKLRIEAIEGAGGGVPAAIAEIRAEIAAIETVLAGLPDPYDDAALVARVVALETIVDEIPDPYDEAAVVARLAALESAVATIPDAYDDAPLVARIEEVEVNVGVAQDRADSAYNLAMQGGGEGPPFDDTPLRNRLTALETDVTALESAVATIPDAYDDAPLVARVAAVEDAVDAIPAPFDDTPLLDRLSAIETALDALPAGYDDSPIRAELAALRAQVEALTNPNTPTPETGWVVSASPGQLTIIGMPEVPMATASVDTKTIMIEAYNG